MPARLLDGNQIRDQILAELRQEVDSLASRGIRPGLAAVLVGLVRAAAVHYRPELDLFSIYLVMAIVLIARPKGLFSAQEARKI